MSIDFLPFSDLGLQLSHAILMVRRLPGDHARFVQLAAQDFSKEAL
jgi:hypothetical protein